MLRYDDHPARVEFVESSDTGAGDHLVHRGLRELTPPLKLAGGPRLPRPIRADV